MRRLLSIIAAMMLSLYAMAQDNLYVVMKDGSVQSFPMSKVDSLTFYNPETGNITDIGGFLERIEAMKSKIDSLREVATNCFAKDTTTNPSVGGHEYVDLGLPSGTLWATANMGASSPEKFGDFFAWGDTVTKAEYVDTGLKWYLNKISYLQEEGVIDKNYILDGAFDAATANWGSEWRMPTDDEFRELYTECTNKWMSRNGREGFEFTGPNGKTLFIPASGHINNVTLNGVGERGDYWTSYTGVINRAATSFYFTTKELSMYSRSVHYGMQIRPVLRSE